MFHLGIGVSKKSCHDFLINPESKKVKSFFLDKTLAAVLSCLGVDGSSLSTSTKAVGYVGYFPKIFQSGQTHRENTICKRGPQLLRWALYMAAVASLKHNPEMRTLYHRKPSQGKTGFHLRREETPPNHAGHAQIRRTLHSSEDLRELLSYQKTCSLKSEYRVENFSICDSSLISCPTISLNSRTFSSLLRAGPGIPKRHCWPVDSSGTTRLSRVIPSMGTGRWVIPSSSRRSLSLYPVRPPAG